MIWSTFSEVEGQAGIVPGALEWHVKLNLHLVMRCHRPQNWGLIIFKTLSPFAGFPGKKCFLVPGAAAHQLSPPSFLYKEERWGVQAVLGGRDENVHMPSGHWIVPVFSGSTVWSTAMRTQSVTEVRSVGCVSAQGQLPFVDKVIMKSLLPLPL